MTAEVPPTRRKRRKARRKPPLPVSVLLAPVIPGLNDDQIPAVLERAVEAGARRADLILLRLPGSVKEVFFERIGAAFPDRVKKIEARIREARGGELYDSRFFHRHRGTGVYWQTIESVFDLHRRRLGLDTPRAKLEVTPFRRPGPEQLSLF